MKFINELKHHFKKHPKEMIYFLLIYTFSLIPGTILFLYFKNHHYSLIPMILSLTISSIPASLFIGYSSKKIGFKYPFIEMIVIFFLLNSSLLFVTNLDYKIFPWGWNVVFAIVFISGFYFARNDSCSCEKSLNRY